MFPKECNFLKTYFDVSNAWQCIEIKEKCGVEMQNANAWDIGCRCSYELKCKEVERTSWIPQFWLLLIQGGAAVRVKNRIPFEDSF